MASNSACASIRGSLLTWAVACSALAGFLMVVIPGCAQKGRPVGGPPDTTPPEVLASNPAPEAVGIPRDAAMTFEFSEPIDRTTLLPNLFVSPRIAGAPEVKWSKGDRVVHLRWADSLRADATYRLTVGARVSDRHNISFAQAYTLAFSTGTRIDRGRISGYVRAAEGTPGGTPTYNVALYDADRAVDTFYLTEPEYITQTGQGVEREIPGWFDLPFLKTGRYLVLAFADKDRNSRLDPGEVYGLPQHDPLLSDSDLTDTVAIFAAPYDTAGFCLNTCTATPWGGLTLILSQPADTLEWENAAFCVVDSLTADTIRVTALRPDFRRPAAVTLVCEGLSTGRTYLVEVDGIRDQRGYPLCPDASCRVLFAPEPDTIGPMVDWTHLPGMRKGVSPTDAVVLQFDEPVDTVGMDTILTATDTAGALLAASARWDDTRTLSLRPDIAWPEKTEVRVVLDSARLHDMAGNAAPSQAFRWQFTPVAGSDMGSVEGRIIIEDPSDVTVTCRLTVRQVRGVLSVTRAFSAPGRFAWDLPAGEWTLEGYLDTDADGHWFSGALNPYAHPEPRTVLSDTLVVRPRFTLEDITVHF